MATIIQGGPDLRQAALEQGVSKGIENYFQERERAHKEQKYLDAFRAVNAATSYDEAVKAMGLVDRELLANPAAMQLLGDQVARKFPAQESVQVDDGSGNISTVGVRKGDVAGGIAAAQAQGGRLAQDTELERTRTFQDEDQATQLLDADYKRVLGGEKLKLEERRTKAAELRAQAAMQRSKQGKGPSEKDKEIARVSELLGGDTARAMKIVYKLEDTDIDPATGEARVLDRLSGRVAVIPAESLGDMDHVPTPKEGESLWDAAVAGTGPFSALRAAAALPIAYGGVFTKGLAPNKTIEARQKLDLSTQKLVRALAANPRYASAELERIRKDFSMSPSMWTHPETLRRRMVTVDSELRLWQAQAERDAIDPKLPGKNRAEAKASLSAIKNFIADMNVPEEHRNGQQEQNVETVPESVTRAYPEVTFERWNRLSREQKKRLMEN